MKKQSKKKLFKGACNMSWFFVYFCSFNWNIFVIVIEKQNVVYDPIRHIVKAMFQLWLKNMWIYQS